MTTPATDRRVWLITGATSGFGRSLAEEILRRGDIVVGAGRTTSRLDDLKDAYPDQLIPVALDVTDTARDAAVVDETVESLALSGRDCSARTPRTSHLPCRSTPRR
jgi:NADP-dependent 3-hydroxy acid dehydrogenase YdfG